VMDRWDYMESGGTFYQDMDRLVALERGLRTWAKWVDSNIDTTRTRVFFQSISPTHYKYVSPPLSHLIGLCFESYCPLGVVLALKNVSNFRDVCEYGICCFFKYFFYLKYIKIIFFLFFKNYF